MMKMSNNVICELDTKKIFKSPIQIGLCVITFGLIVVIIYLLIILFTKNSKKNKYEGYINFETTNSTTPVIPIEDNIVFKGDVLLNGGATIDEGNLKIITSNNNISTTQAFNDYLKNDIKNILSTIPTIPNNVSSSMETIDRKLNNFDIRLINLEDKINIDGKLNDFVNDFNTRISNLETNFNSNINNFNSKLTDFNEYLSNYLPIGTIVAWYPDNPGNPATLPPGWAICDGDGGTPDLRNKFIMGSSNKSETSSTVECAMNSSNTSCNISLSVANLPDHSHLLPMTYSGRTNACEDAGVGGSCYRYRGVIYTSSLPDKYKSTSKFPGADIDNLDALNYNNLLSSGKSYRPQGNDSNVVIKNINWYNKTNQIDKPDYPINSNKAINILPPYYKMIYIIKKSKTTLTPTPTLTTPTLTTPTLTTPTLTTPTLTKTTPT